MATRTALYLAIIFFFASCATRRMTNNGDDPSVAVREKAAVLNEKNYLRGATDTNIVLPVAVPEPVIQKNDILHIRVFSQSINPETDVPYNLVESSTGNSSGASPTAGFLVDSKGNIEYPQIGTLHVEGLTKEQVAASIKDKLKTMNALYNPSVIVRFLNYKVTVLGEVKNPMTYTAATDRISILDALGMAGDVTDFGDKSNVKVARMENGKMEIGKIDLTSPAFFTSPYYWLKQNDYVFVEPSIRKQWQDERELRQDAREIRQDAREFKQQERQSVGAQIGIIGSIITSIALILNLLK